MFKEYSKKDNQVIQKVGLKVKELRNKGAISQNELALRADIPKNQVGRIERGEINTSLVTLYRISAALKVELTELFK